MRMCPAVVRPAERDKPRRSRWRDRWTICPRLGWLPLASENGETESRAGGIVRAMHLDREALYRALRTRDARFDGRIFVGVRTTGIYCRPICPARTPKLENVEFYASAAAAQEAGF